MSDLIDRQAAIDAIHREFDEVCVWDESGQTTANEVENILYEVPSAEPEQKKGKWIEDETGYGYWTCSVCGFVTEASAANILYHYCPNCGAEMTRGE